MSLANHPQAGEVAAIDRDISSHITALHALRFERNQKTSLAYRLNTTISCEIFLWLRAICASDDPIPSHTIIRLNLPGSLRFIPWAVTGQVCSHWRNAGLACGQLWNHLNLASLPWTKELLKRSENAQLRIAPRPLGQLIDRDVLLRCLSFVLSHASHRISSLHLDYWFLHSTPPTKQISLIVAALSEASFSSLKSFTYVFGMPMSLPPHVTTLIEDICASSPQLRHLQWHVPASESHFSAIARTLAGFRALQTLRHLDLGCSPNLREPGSMPCNRVIQCLRDLPFLETLSVIGVFLSGTRLYSETQHRIPHKGLTQLLLHQTRLSTAAICSIIEAFEFSPYARVALGCNGTNLANPSRSEELDRIMHTILQPGDSTAKEVRKAKGKGKSKQKIQQFFHFLSHLDSRRLSDSPRLNWPITPVRSFYMGATDGKVRLAFSAWPELPVVPGWQNIRLGPFCGYARLQIDLCGANMASPEHASWFEEHLEKYLLQVEHVHVVCDHRSPSFILWNFFSHLPNLRHLEVARAESLLFPFSYLRPQGSNSSSSYQIPFPTLEKLTLRRTNFADPLLFIPASISSSGYPLQAPFIPTPLASVSSFNSSGQPTDTTPPLSLANAEPVLGTAGSQLPNPSSEELIHDSHSHDSNEPIPSPPIAGGSWDNPGLSSWSLPKSLHMDGLLQGLKARSEIRVGPRELVITNSYGVTQMFLANCRALVDDVQWDEHSIFPLDAEFDWAEWGLPGGYF